MPFRLSTSIGEIVGLQSTQRFTQGLDADRHIRGAAGHRSQMQGPERSTLTAAESLGVLSAVRFRHATPDSVGFTRAERVIATLHEHGAGLANLPGLRFAPVTGVAALIVRREEHRQVGTPARGTRLPASGITVGM
ncbi:hypothetical protein EP51_33545 [Rhodococcus opacus]|uniref:Uncharacterized protein n=1 Tax=Rhodococcus opacus TaxID=37919 RepID=A0A076ETZ0_RHOOP|nr:hypothetical protein EP51_33545 [Rhodococcus opacus]